MSKNSLQIVWTALVLGIIGILYFLSLLIHLPVYAALALILAAASVLYKRLMQLAETNRPFQTRTEEVWSYVLFVGGLFLLVNKGFYLAAKYGQWDAWAIWNYHALFLKDAGHWSSFLDAGVDSHPDYPLFLPAVSAFFWRLFGNTDPLIPFSISLAVSLLAPVWIYLETYRKNVVVAGVVLILIATDEAYLTRSLSQLADHMLGFFLMGAFICFDHFRVTRNLQYLLITGAFIGLCPWIKNEGLMLGIVFTVFNIPALFCKQDLKYFLTGILIPLATFTLFKVFYAPPNDLVAMSKTSNVAFLTDKSRYGLIYDTLQKTISEKFSYHRIGIMLYAILCLVEKKLPDRNLIIIAACLAGYFVVYLLTPYDLQWHLDTSADRLLHQLAPAFLYTVSLRLCHVQLLLPQKNVL